MSQGGMDPKGESRWLLLMHQLPAKPVYLRVKVWRRLQALGAVAVKKAVYALPASDQAQEDFEWVMREIVESGGEAFVCEARLVDGLSDHEVRAFFDRTRDADYEAIVKDARALAAELSDARASERRAEGKAQLGRLRARLVQVNAIDFFGANASNTAHALLRELEAKLEEVAPRPEPTSQPIDLRDLTGRVWVTRVGVFVDRIASAWLIRRWIDRQARFKFVPAKGYVPEEGELRFDMYEAEFTHEGERCTFEVLLGRAGVKDPALAAIAEIVHDIDLKDGKFGRAEVGGVRNLIEGICLTNADDQERLQRGGAVFDDLYRFFRKRR